MAAEDAYKSQYTSLAGFQDAYHKAKQRGREDKEYRRGVREREAKELDEVNGQLIVDPSGQSNWDAGVETMAMDWKKGFADARQKFNNGEMSADEYSLIKNDYLNRSKQYNAASQNIKNVVSQYDEALQNGTVSDATPPEIRDLLDTLRKGDGDLQPQNIDGVPTLVGVTAGGQAVSIPLNQLASGKGLPRFNAKVDLTAQKDAILKDLDSFKHQFSTADGSVYEQSLGADKLNERATEKVEQLLANDTTLKSIAADEYGIADDDERWQTPEGIQQIRDEVTQNEVNDITSGLIQRTTLVRPGRPAPQPSAAAIRASAGGAGTRQLYDRVGQSLQDYIGTDKLLDADAVLALQGEVGGNIEGIEFSEGERNWFSPDTPAGIFIKKKGSDDELFFPADGNPADLAQMLALAKYGDAAVADTRNTINTGVNQQTNVDEFDFEI